MRREVPKDHEYDETGQCKWCEHKDPSKASFAAPTGYLAFRLAMCQVVTALEELESACLDEGLRRETRTIKDAYQSRITALEALHAMRDNEGS